MKRMDGMKTNLDGMKKSLGMVSVEVGAISEGCLTLTNLP